MNSLSSHSAKRSVSGSISEQRSPTEDASPSTGPRPSAPVPQTSAPVRKRVMAPPPTTYVKDDRNHAKNGVTKEDKKGTMLYAFDSGAEGELSVSEGREVVLLEPDGKPCKIPTNALL